MPAVVLPDIINAVRAHLLADDDLAALVAGRVTLTLPDPLVLPAIRIQRIGGSLAEYSNPEGLVGPDRAQFSVHCWAETVHAADRLAAVCRGALHEMPSTPHAGVVVSRVDGSGAPQTIWDTSRAKALPRTVLTVSITYR